MTEADFERTAERLQLTVRALGASVRQLHHAVDTLNRRLGRPDEQIQAALDAAIHQLDRVRL